MKPAVRINPRGRVVNVSDFLRVIQRVNCTVVASVWSSRARIAAAVFGFLLIRSIDCFTSL
jgi:hypothetical protein